MLKIESQNKQENHTLDHLMGHLPFQYQSIKVFQSHRPIGFRFYNQSIVIEAIIQDKSIIACGEDSELTVAVAKARSELVERTALLTFSKSDINLYRGSESTSIDESSGSVQEVTSAHFTTSNGWAAHPQKHKAEIGAVLELLERDAIMAQWYKQTPFIELKAESFPTKIQKWVSYELAQSEFPILRILLSTEGFGVSITCLLINNQGYGVCGHSTKLQLEDAIDNAIGEACRAAQFTLRKSFWQDSLVLKDLCSDTKIDPGAHGVYYAYHEAFPQWMFGNKVSCEIAQTIWNKSISRVLANYLDEFNLFTEFHASLFVSCATHPKALKLTWGTTDEKRIEELRANERLKGAAINTKPHIIS